MSLRPDLVLNSAVDWLQFWARKWLLETSVLVVVLLLYHWT